MNESTADEREFSVENTVSAHANIAPGPISFFALLVPFVITGALYWYFAKLVM